MEYASPHQSLTIDTVLVFTSNGRRIIVINLPVSFKFEHPAARLCL